MKSTHVALCIVGSLLAGAAIGAHFTALHWDQKLESWVSKFTEDNYNLNMASDIHKIGVMHEQARLFEKGDINEFKRKTCLYMKIMLDGVELSNYKKSSKSVSIVNNAKEYVAINTKNGLCEHK